MIGKPNQQVQPYTVAASNNRDHILLLIRITYDMVAILCAHLVCGESHIQRYLRGCNNIPSFLQKNVPITHSIYDDCTWHDLHILVTVPFRCDWKAQAASAQRFALWLQATLEITLSLLVHTAYVWVVFFTLIPFVVNRTFNATLTKRLQHQ